MNEQISKSPNLLYIIAPCVMTIALIILGMVNYQVQNITLLSPFFAATSVYYWNIYQPPLMNKFVVFFIGLFQDILYNTTLGSTSFILLIFLWAVKSQRIHIYHQPFYVSWLVFTGAISIFCFLSWAINCILINNIILNEAIIYQLLITILFYPIAHKLFTYFSRF